MKWSPNVKPSNGVEDSCNNFCETILEASRALGFFKTVKHKDGGSYNNNDKAWVDSECYVLIKAVKDSLANCKKLNISKNSKEQCIRAKQKYRSAIKSKKENHQKNLTESLTNIM